MLTLFGTFEPSLWFFLVPFHKNCYSIEGRWFLCFQKSQSVSILYHWVEFFASTLGSCALCFLTWFWRVTLRYFAKGLNRIISSLNPVKGWIEVPSSKKYCLCSGLVDCYVPHVRVYLKGFWCFLIIMLCHLRTERIAGTCLVETVVHQPQSG